MRVFPTGFAEMIQMLSSFLDCRDGDKKPGKSILDVGVETALLHSGFDEKTFLDRGGIFDWTRSQRPKNLEW
jgi:radical S-adenosyl methionine domain-containing protein 2